MRDDFNTATKRYLAQQVSYRCSNPDCRAVTIGCGSSPGKPGRVGVAAHITAAAPGGPRYDPSMSSDERVSYENGIWLCQTHARLIDSDPARFPTGLLREWKERAERLSAERLGRQELAAPDLQDAVLEAVAVHEIRVIRTRLSFGQEIDANLERLWPYARDFGPRVVEECLTAISEISERTRIGISEDVAQTMWHLVGRLLPITSIAKPSKAPIAPADERLLSIGLRIGFDIAYDAAKYLDNPRIVWCGADLMHRVMRFAHLNGYVQLLNEANEDFDTVEENAADESVKDMVVSFRASAAAKDLLFVPQP